MKKGFSVSALKYIAVICMLLDHIAVVFLESGPLGQTRLGEMMDVPLRAVGRWSFPLFLFCLLQGYFHTHDRMKYAARLFIAAILSEIPYDFGHTGQFFSWNQNNVIWTMFLIIVMLLCYDNVHAREKEKDIRLCYYGMIWSGVALLAYIGRTDYGFAAVTAATVLYFCQKRQTFGYGLSILVLSVLMSPVEALALPTVFFVRRYNHERGRQNPYFFYLFYPLHFVFLRILYLLFFPI